MKRFVGEDPTGFSGGQSNFYAYVGGDPLDSTDPYGLAQFGFRPLGDGAAPFGPGKAPNAPGALDLNVAHEDLWFDDMPKDNIGFFAGNGNKPGWKMCGEAGVVRPDIGHDRSQYSFFGPKYDDQIMRQAVANVAPKWNDHAYCLAGHNCQTFSDALRSEYQRLQGPHGASGSW